MGKPEEQALQAAKLEEEDVTETSAKNSGGKDKKKRREHRASIVTRLMGNLQREDQSKSSWVVGLLFFEKDPGFQVLRDTVGKRLLEIPRFRSKLVAVRRPARMQFEELDDDEIDMDYHFRQVFEDKVVSQQELDDFVGGMFHGFDRKKGAPLWQVTYVPKLEDGRACLITNISHIIGDGISQVEVLMRLLDKQDVDDDPMQRQPSLQAPKRRKPPALGPITKTKVVLGGIWNGFFSVFGRPDRNNTLRLKDTNNPSGTKRCCFSDTIDLQRVKELKNMYDGATLNDVLVTLLTLTLRAYFEENDPKTLKKRVRAQFPINTRGRKEGAFRGENPSNKFAYGFMPFHISHKGDQSALLWKTKRTLDKIKSSPSPFVQQRLGSILIKFMPLKAMNAQLLNLANKATAQVSNVPGPQGKVTLAGAPVDDMRFLLYSPLSFYCGLLTYNGQLSASFCIDSALADPHLLAKHWVPEFEKFYAHAKERSGVEKLIHRPTSLLDCL